jgi:hypothetical protein
VAVLEAMGSAAPSEISVWQAAGLPMSTDNDTHACRILLDAAVLPMMQEVLRTEIGRICREKNLQRNGAES